VPSYDAIAAALGRAPGELLFLSDLPAELHAAREAGWQVVGVRRDGEPNAEADFGDLRVVASFDELEVDAAVAA
jgi:enolase-phosphatase E1